MVYQLYGVNYICTCQPIMKNVFSMKNEIFHQGLFITAELHIKPDVDLDVALSAIHVFCEGMNSETGCSFATALQDQKDPRKIIFWERYDDQAAFEQHFNADHTQHFIKAGLTDLVQAFESKLLLQEI